MSKVEIKCSNIRFSNSLKLNLDSYLTNVVVVVEYTEEKKQRFRFLQRQKHVTTDMFHFNLHISSRMSPPTWCSDT